MIQPRPLLQSNSFAIRNNPIIDAAPIETSASGKVIFDLPNTIAARWLKGLEWSFEGGRVKSYNAEENLDLFESFYKKGTGNKDQIGYFGLGINPKAETGFLHDDIVQGVVSIGIGRNLNLGGENNTSFQTAGSLTGATVELDGKIILRDGKYVI